MKHVKTSIAPMITFFSALIIFSLGLLMIFSTTSAEILDHARDKSTHQALFKQIFYAMAGLLLGVALWKIGYMKIISNSSFLLGLFTFFLLLVLIPGLGQEVNGSRRWLNIAGLSFQPSEFVKYLLPAFFIHHYLKIQGQGDRFKGFLKLVGIVAVPIFLVLIEPNNGTAFVIGLVLVVLFLLMGVPFRYWALPLGIFVIVGGTFASQLPYISGRIHVYLHPELDLKGRGHQPHQAKIAVGSGQLLGKGPGNSLQKLSYLPEAQNDYIAAIYAEEMGFLGIACLIALYLTLCCAGLSIALESKSQEGLYFGGSIVFLIVFQAFLNMGVVSGLIPSTGLNLPLFSQGGTSLMANMAGLGLLLSIGKPHIIKKAV